MKRPLLFVQDPNALKNWLTACGSDAKVLYDLKDLTSKFKPSEFILLIQITDDDSIKRLVELAREYEIIATANEPSDQEGLELFKNGVKGYINTFSTVERMQQAIATIQSGSIWLGQNVMQAMIQSLVDVNQPKEGWKEKLTEREQQTAELVLENKTNKEIAEQLEITERTVKAHIHNIFEKLDVTDRLALVLKIKNWQ